MRRMFLLTITCLAVSSCQRDTESTTPQISPESTGVASAGTDWPAFGRTANEQRYSPLQQIDATNVQALAVDWYLDLPDARTLYGTPLVVGRTMYFESSYNVVHAVDAASGRLIWRYDPEVTKQAGERLRIMWDGSRGLAYDDGRVFIATVDGRLVAIDAATGVPVWSTLTVDPDLPYYITGAPKVFRGLVVIGNGGTEDGPIRGYLDAYDVDTGERVWRWYTVPGNPADGFENDAMKMAADTWNGEWWRYGGGGTVWHAITYDAEFDQVIFGTGNGAPWNRRIRSPDGGDNLFLCAVVALDAKTGQYRWHYQTTPGEAWDYNSNMDIVLADLEIDGRTVKAALHAPKNGFFYVLDRENGQLISAEPFVNVTWASRVDLATGRPVENEGARYEDGEEAVAPSALGGHSWHAMSFNPETGLVYIPTMELTGFFSDKSVDVRKWQSPDWRFDSGVDPLLTDVPADAGSSALKAWDPVRQRAVWQVATPGLWNAGTLTTAGNLVFQGQADGRLMAHRATDGETLWSFDLGLGISAPPITYSVDGRQYVALLVGWGGAGAAMMGSLSAQHGWTYGAQTRRLVVFSLEGELALPQSASPASVAVLASDAFEVDPALAESGGRSYFEMCWLCHGAAAISGGTAPDLRASPIVLASEALRDVVIGGRLQDRGMPGFPSLSEEELTTIQHYIRRAADTALADD
jgi:quinohemoprotein ethanol dehydrogenase